MVQNGEGTVGKRARSVIGFSSRGVQCKRRSDEESEWQRIGECVI